LGTVALRVFSDPAGAIPDLGFVLKVITEVMRAANPAASEEDARIFVQEVAESTGLLVLHRGAGEEHSWPVTFMHHSFLEYYAALGLCATEYIGEMAVLSRLPRWREVVTLLAGIVGDHEDISGLVDVLLTGHEPAEQITMDLTILALDCALESDIPPERAIRMLLARLEDDVRTGSLLSDRELRS
jgi:hypothetical protein